MLSHLQRSIVVFVVLATGSGKANATPQHRQMEHCGRQQHAKTELICARRALYANAGEARWIRNHITITRETASWPDYWYVRRRFLAWRVRVDRRLIAEAHRRLVAAGPRIAHVALWLCIHRGEGSWADDGAPYYGGLQMHAGWGYGSSYHANWDSPVAQMQAAESGYRASGYSAAWLRGQWPRTSPPCMGLS